MNLRKWLYFGFINLLIVAVLGLVLRYKIAFSLPFIDQKNLQHAHSHFALVGWVSQVLMVLISYHVSNRIGVEHFKKYYWILVLNMISAFGMLFSFPFQGYGSVSIGFSTFSILASYIFAVRVWKDINRIAIKSPVFNWFKAALVFSVLSSAGIFWMVYLMVTKSMNPNYHLASVYLYLHFQYNGWFVFSCFGLIASKLPKLKVHDKVKLFFWINALACIPAYFLSAPWLSIPSFIFVIVVISALAQLISWVWISFSFGKKIREYLNMLPTISKIFLSLSAIAYTIKVLLQLLSSIPALSEIAFGYRPVVVAYLHLVFLGVISMFLFGFIMAWIFTEISKLAKVGILVFVVAFIVSEAVLATQGIFAISYKMFPLVNEILLAVTVIMVSGLILFNVGLHQKKIK